jgi:HEAT repeat protein
VKENAVDLSTTPPGKILEAIRRGDLREKRTLIESLSHQPTDRALQILSEILEGESWYLRDLAGKAMARMGAIAVPRLRQLSASGLWYTRASAARALGRVGHEESLPLLVALLADANLTVQGASLASISDLVRAGAARDVARLFWNEGARRAEDLGKILLDVHPEAGRQVMEYLGNPASFLSEAAPREEETPEAEIERKNA